YILAAIRLAILCGYSSVLLLVIVCLDHLSIYIPDFTHFNLHSPYGFDFTQSMLAERSRSHTNSVVLFSL
ncbi:MAG: hypothetical protein ACK571_18340, partial [Pseudanabaena sp.]